MENKREVKMENKREVKMGIDDNFKIFSKKGKFVIKRMKENKLITYEDKPFTFKAYGDAFLVAKAIAGIEKNSDDNSGYWKHKIDDMGYWPSKIK